MKKSKLTHHGFTLVELLVVILIIAVLAALAMSVVKRMRQSADNAVTNANLRQIGVALLSYTSETGRFPSLSGDPVWDRCLFTGLGYPEAVTGTGEIKPSSLPVLANTAKTFSSPGDKEPRAKDTYKRSFAIVPWTTNWSNGTSFRGWKDQPYNKGIRYQMLTAPEKAAMVVQWHAGTTSIPNNLGAGNHAYHDIGGPVAALGEKQQVLFADGHVESISAKMKTADFISKYWPGTVGTTN